MAATLLFLAGAPIRVQAAGPRVLAHLEEESIPAAEISATPTETPSPAPGASPVPTDTPTATSTPSDVFREPTPVPPASDVQPLEAGSVTPSLRISDSSIQDAIDKEANPARAASMRMAEQARTELLDGHPEQASRNLQRAVEIDPSDPYAYFYLGRVYITEKNYPQALTFLKRAEIGFGSGNPLWLSETLAFEGLTYEESGRDTAAAAAYQQALQINSGNLMARVGYTRSAPAPVAAPEGAPGTGADVPPPAGGAIPPPPAEVPPPPPPNSSSPSTD